MSKPHRKIDVLYRSACIRCQRLIDDAEAGLRSHYRAKHRPPPPQKQPRRDMIGRDGRLRCRHVENRLKVIYESRDVAWVEAWRIFAQRGHFLTPYQCAAYVFEYRVPGNTRRIAHFGCGRWHLARTEHVMMLGAAA